MLKYFSIYRQGLRSLTVFRFNFLMDFITQLILIFVKISLWQAIFYSGRNSSMSLSQLTTYFLYVLMISQITSNSLTIAKKIKNGTLSNDLIKPIHPTVSELFQVMATKTMTLIKWIPVFLILILIYSKFFIFHFSIYGIVFVFLGFFLAFYIQVTIQSLAFWILEISSINYIFSSILTVFSGSLIPYDYLPSFLRDIFEMLPFKYTVHVPINVLLGRVSVYDQQVYLAGGIIYLLFFIVLNHFLFKAGLKKYTSMGG